MCFCKIKISNYFINMLIHFIKTTFIYFLFSAEQKSGQDSSKSKLGNQVTNKCAILLSIFYTQKKNNRVTQI